MYISASRLVLPNFGLVHFKIGGLQNRAYISAKTHIGSFFAA